VGISVLAITDGLGEAVKAGFAEKAGTSAETAPAADLSAAFPDGTVFEQAQSNIKQVRSAVKEKTAFLMVKILLIRFSVCRSFFIVT
jgi:hypothetical protein